MMRDAWAAGWTKPIHKWAEWHRFIRKVGGITPSSAIPNGTILMLTENSTLPEGWEWVPELDGKEGKDVWPLA